MIKTAKRSLAVMAAAAMALGVGAAGPDDIETQVRELLSTQGPRYLEMRARVRAAEEPAAPALSAALEGDLPPRQRRLAEHLLTAWPDEGGLGLVLETVAEVRAEGPTAGPDRVSSRAVERAVARWGEMEIPGAVEFLLARAAEPPVLEGVLLGLANLPAASAGTICPTLVTFLEDGDNAAGERLRRAALTGLRMRGADCRASVPELVRIYEGTDAASGRYDLAEALGWVGASPEDVQAVQRLAVTAGSECERRLLSMTALRILDRSGGF